MEYDLEAHRCPNAQIKVNRVLLAFADSDEKVLEVKTIEPSLLRSIRERIVHQSLSVTVDNVTASLVTDRLRQQWLNSFHEEDFEDIDKQFTITILKAAE